MLVRFETCSLKFTAMWWFKENPVWRSLFGRRCGRLVGLSGHVLGKALGLKQGLR